MKLLHFTKSSKPNDDFNESICSPKKSWHPVCDVNKVVAHISGLLGEVGCVHKCHRPGAPLEKGAFGAPEMKLLNHNGLCSAHLNGQLDAPWLIAPPLSDVNTIRVSL